MPSCLHHPRGRDRAVDLLQPTGTPALLAELADAHDIEITIIGVSRDGTLSLLERILGDSVSTSLAHHAHRAVLLVPATYRRARTISTSSPTTYRLTSSACPSAPMMVGVAITSASSTDRIHALVSAAGCVSL